MMFTTTSPLYYEILTLWALTHADQNAPALYSSRIDGLLFPHCGELEFWL